VVTSKWGISETRAQRLSGPLVEVVLPNGICICLRLSGLIGTRVWQRCGTRSSRTHGTQTALGWRDVQHIFVNTSRINDAADGDWFVNGAGFHHNHKYGFGLVDASAAVESAGSHVNLPALRVSSSPVNSVGKSLNDFSPVEAAITITDRLIVETVEVVFTAQHPARGNLYITLTSPSGTISVLQDPHADRSANIDGWTYTTVRSWGEQSYGDWILHVEDKTSGSVGVWTSWQLNVYGH